MRKYETLLLISPDLGTEETTKVVDAFKGIIEREGGTVLLVDDWGLKDLAYPVKKHLRGRYIRLEYGLASLAVAELERIIRITDGVYKFVTVKLADAVEVAAEEAA